MRGLIRTVSLVALGVLWSEYRRRGKVERQLRALGIRQREVIAQGAVLTQALRDEVAGRRASGSDGEVQVPLGVEVADAVTIRLGPLEGLTEAEWEAWRGVWYATVRRLVGERLAHRRTEDVARLEAMARGVGPDAAPPEGRV